MASRDSQELEDLKIHMRSVRNSDYRAALELIKDDLGLPGKTSDSEVEALLIYATRECFQESLDADIVLSAFGLLKGFDNQHDTEETKNADALITIRRKMFIKKSSYVADRHGPHNKRRKVYYRSYSELEAAGEAAIDAVLSALGSEDGNLINCVAQKIHAHKRQIISYLQESKKYLDVDENECILGVKLPDLIHINQDVTHPVEGGAGGAGSDTADSEKCLKLLMCVIGLAILFVVVVGTILLLFTKTLAENRGQFEVHASSYDMRLDFAPSDYDRPSDSEMRFNDEPGNPSN